MAKNKNKGFTLIEIMIAIAILSILLVPIMKQFAQTLDTSRRAKELQYLNENAGYILELSQRENLAKVAIATHSDAAKEADNIKLKSTPTENTIPCQVYNIDGSEVAGAGGTVTYKATRYELNDAELGIKNNVYERTVITDDLSAKLASVNASGNGYKVAYGLTDADLANFPSGFELTNEGSIVRYNSEGFVNGVACYSTATVKNPNDTNLGNMQDLDATKVAIIPGTAQSFDAQADSQFFSITMDRLKREDYDSWVQAMMHESSDSVLNTIDYDNAIQKLTKIYVDKNDNGTPSDDTDDYYIIKADVYYKNTYQFDINGGSSSVSDEAVLSYNVFSQKFYTDRCPDIYFEYQPYTTSYVYGAAPSVRYAENDDIMIDNYAINPDSDGDGNPDLVKLYLYKPTADQRNTASGITDNNHAYYVSNASTNKVKINLYRANSKGHPVDIYTNLYKTSMGVNVVDPEQFKVNARTTIDTVVTDSPRPGDKADAVRYNYSYNNIKLIEEDTRYSDRLLTVTVKLTPKDSDNRIVTEIKLTGAKGEN